MEEHKNILPDAEEQQSLSLLERFHREVARKKIEKEIAHTRYRAERLRILKEETALCDYNEDLRRTRSRRMRKVEE